eukprot:3866156-Alexandrium_andersonii.AAC.1
MQAGRERDPSVDCGDRWPPVNSLRWLPGQRERRADACPEVTPGVDQMWCNGGARKCRSSLDRSALNKWKRWETVQNGWRQWERWGEWLGTVGLDWERCER